MNRKSQVLIISLWILSILTVFAVGIGHRVSMSLRLTRYQRDSLKAYYLAKAGINRAIAEIEKDSAASDSLNDPWANNEAAFKKISFNEKAPEFATVSYTMINADNQEERVYGVEDEERKININSASKELLVSLLEKAGVNGPERIADYIIAWRQGVGDPEAKDYSLLGYQCKAAPFTNLEELLLVKNIDSATFDAIKNNITLWGKGKININTADKDTLEVVFSSVEGVDEAGISSVVNTIDNYRKGGNSPFSSLQDAVLLFTAEADQGLFNAAAEKFTVTSSAFRIESEGHVRNLIKKISVIYDRSQKKIVYWHES